LNWVVRSISELETNITSVERIIHQTEVQSEAPDEQPETEPTEEWPSQGAIEFDHYKLVFSTSSPLGGC
jgi:ATP-binding cassette subfamily C (CFTR/MRP) protein 1